MKIQILIFAVLCLGQGAFAADRSTDETVAKRWERAYQKELKQAVGMYEEGDPLSKPQMYEMARTYILYQLHSRLDIQLEKEQISPGEYDVLKSVFTALIQCNPPGGCDLSCFQAIVSKKTNKTFQNGSTSAQFTRATVKSFLMENIKETGISAEVVSYLVGTPFTWKVFLKRLSAPDRRTTWQEQAKRLAQETNKVLTASAKLFGISAIDFSGAVPPAVRVNFIEKVGTAGQPQPQDIVHSIKAYEEYGQTYGLYGWQGIVKTFLDTSWEQRQEKATLKDFTEFLKENSVILQDVDLENHSSDPAAEASEKKLDSFFTQISIFSVE